MNDLKSAADAVVERVGEAGETLRRVDVWARAGYAARGFLYLVLAWVALSSGRSLSTSDTVRAIADLPFGQVLVVLTGLGLLGYGLYKLVTAFADLDARGSDAKGIGQRAFNGLGGIAYLALAWAAWRATGEPPAASAAPGAAGVNDGGAVADAAAGAAEVAGSGGATTLLLIAALVVAGVAAVQAVIAAKASFMKDMSPRSPASVRLLGQAGYGARAIVLALVAWFLLKAGLDGGRIADFGEALASLKTTAPWLYLPVTLGLGAFGVTSLLMARYRGVCTGDGIASVKDKLAG